MKRPKLVEVQMVTEAGTIVHRMKIRELTNWSMPYVLIWRKKTWVFDPGMQHCGERYIEATFHRVTDKGDEG